MGLANLPLASGQAHAQAFVRLGWTLDPKRRGRGSHLRLTKKGVREVKRTIIASLIKIADETEERYLRAYCGENLAGQPRQPD